MTLTEIEALAWEDVGAAEAMLAPLVDAGDPDALAFIGEPVDCPDGCGCEDCLDDAVDLEVSRERPSRP